MADQRMVYVSAQTHRRLKLLAAHRKRTMGEIVSDLVERIGGSRAVGYFGMSESRYYVCPTGGREAERRQKMGFQLDLGTTGLASRKRRVLGTEW